MPIDTQHMDPRCKSCEEKGCSNCTQFGTRFILRAPPIPWLSGDPLERPKMPPPWEPFSWMKE